VSDCRYRPLRRSFSAAVSGSSRSTDARREAFVCLSRYFDFWDTPVATVATPATFWLGYDFNFWDTRPSRQSRQLRQLRLLTVPRLKSRGSRNSGGFQPREVVGSRLTKPRTVCRTKKTLTDPPGMSAAGRERMRSASEQAPAKARGAAFGRPQKMQPDQKDLARELIRDGKSISAVARTSTPSGDNPPLSGRKPGLMTVLCSGQPQQTMRRKAADRHGR
jgi:hypothetical protein